MSLLNELKLPSEWYESFDNEEVHCIELSPDSTQYFSVRCGIYCTLSCRITSIKRIENPFLLGCYCLKKAEYEAKGIDVSERQLYHCTSASNVQNIVKNNLDWRRTVRGKFGQGVSFSPSAKYANMYANRSIGHLRAMLVMKVLVGNDTGGDYSVEIPPLGFDTTTGNNCQVYVKYYDYEFYPMYVVNYSRI